MKRTRNRAVPIRRAGPPALPTDVKCVAPICDRDNFPAWWGGVVVGWRGGGMVGGGAVSRAG
jgi:hypothetical protein